MTTIARSLPRENEKPGVYPATLLKLEEGQSEYQGDLLERYVWTFECRRKDGSTFVMTARTSRKFTAGKYQAKARRYAETILGRAIDAAEAAAGFDLETLIGARCQVVVTVETTDHGTFNEVGDSAYQ